MPKVDKCGQGGEGGVKNGTFVRTSFMDGPQVVLQNKIGRTGVALG